jgi:hypothetical protein
MQSGNIKIPNKRAKNPDYNKNDPLSFLKAKKEKVF